QIVPRQPRPVRHQIAHAQVFSHRRIVELEPRNVIAHRLLPLDLAFVNQRPEHESRESFGRRANGKQSIRGDRQLLFDVAEAKAFGVDDVFAFYDSDSHPGHFKLLHRVGDDLVKPNERFCGLSNRIALAVKVARQISAALSKQAFDLLSISRELALELRITGNSRESKRDFAFIGILVEGYIGQRQIFSALLRNSDRGRELPGGVSELDTELQLTGGQFDNPFPMPGNGVLLSRSEPRAGQQDQQGYGDEMTPRKEVLNRSRRFGYRAPLNQQLRSDGMPFPR